MNKPETQSGGSLEPVGSARRPKLAGWWEEYRCGCVSKTVKRKKDLLGYCGQHGDSRRKVFPDLVMPNTKLSHSRPADGSENERNK